MKKICVIVIVTLCTILSTMVSAATLENRDSQKYKYKLTSEGEDPLKNVMWGTVDDRSKIQICKFGCELTLLETGETITVGPDDHVVIDKGTLKIK